MGASLKSKKSFLFGTLLLAGLNVAHSAAREIAPQALPMKWSAFLEPMGSSETMGKSPLLPEEMKPFMKGSSLDVLLDIEEIKQDVFVISPMNGKELLKKGRVLKVWDKLITGKKSVLELSTGENVQWVLGAESVLQVFAGKDGAPRLRLFKGKLRVESTAEEPVCVETLNAHAKIYKSTVDIKISAMNTLIAPREGDEVDILTRKSHRSVPVGTYGLVMADGSLVFTGGKEKK